MKRHPVFQPLSREHHKGLLLAQLLRKDMPDYKGMPQDVKSKVLYAISSFYEELDSHFKREELILPIARSLNRTLDNLIDEILNEHGLLTEQFKNMDPENTTEEQLHVLGLSLNDHIRKEERILFPMLETYCPEDMLEQFRQML